MKKNAGFTLIEILVVLVVFGFIGIVVSQTVITTIRGTKRSDSDSRVRANIDYVTSVMDRHIRNAVSIACPSAARVDFTDQRQNVGSFLLNGVGADRHIASNSATTPNYRLTGNNTTVTAATFTCNPISGNTPPSVTINLTLEDRNESGSLKSRATTTRTIYLRTSI